METSSDVIKEMASRRVRVHPESNENVLIRTRKDTEIQRRRWCEEGDRDKNDASTNKRTGKIGVKAPEAKREPGAICASEPPEEINPADNLISDFCPPQL